MPSIVVFSDSKKIEESLTSLLDESESLLLADSERLFRSLAVKPSGPELAKLLDAATVVIIDVSGVRVAQLERLFNIAARDRGLPVLFVSNNEISSQIPQSILLGTFASKSISDLKSFDLLRLVMEGERRIEFREQLLKRLGLENLVKDVACNLSVPINHKNPRSIPLFDSLKQISEHLGALEARVFSLSREDNTFSLFQKWISGVEEPGLISSDKTSTSSFPWLIQRLKAGDFVFINNPEDLPSYAQVEKSSLKAEAHSHCIYVPLFAGGEVEGFMTLFFDKGLPKISDDEKTQLEDLSKVIGNYLSRYQKWLVLNSRFEFMKKEIRESEDKFHYVLDSFPEPFLVAAEDGKIIFANSALENLTGFKTSEVLGKKTYQVFYPEHLVKENPQVKEEYEEYKRFMETLYPRRLRGVAEIYTVRLYRKDGRLRVVETRGAPLKTASGEVVGSIGMFVDKTAANRREEESFLIEKTKLLQEAFKNIAVELSDDLEQIESTVTELSRHIVLPDEVRSSLKALRFPIERAIKADEQLSLLTKVDSDSTEPDLSDCQAFFEENLRLISECLGQGVQIFPNFEENLPPVKISKGELLTILLLMTKITGSADNYYLWGGILEEQERIDLTLSQSKYVCLGGSASEAKLSTDMYESTGDLTKTLKELANKIGGKAIIEESSPGDIIVKVMIPSAGQIKGNAVPDLIDQENILPNTRFSNSR